MIQVRHYIFLLLLLWTQTLYSQSVNFVHYQVENGLSHNAVLCTLQDQQGFMWFGTVYGLNRFDGYTFRVFRNTGQPGSLGGNTIISLFQDDNGLLYTGTDKGAYIYNPRTEQFRILHKTITAEVRAIHKDGQGNIWIASGGRLFRYRAAADSLYEHTGFPEASAMCTGSDGLLWVASSEGRMAVYDPQQDAFRSYSLFDHSRPTSSRGIQKIVAAGRDSIWVCTNAQGLKLFDLRTRTYKDMLTDAADHTEIYARDVIRRSSGEYWLASESGIYIYYPESGSVINLKKKYNDPYSISDNAVYSFCKDREGGIWAGTYFGGINYFPQQYTAFEKFFPKTGAASLGGNAVREIHPDKYGHLWIGTEDGGLNKFTPATGDFMNIRPALPPQTGLSHYNIHGLLVTGDSLWIGTFEHGLDIMHIRTGKFIRHYKAGSGPHDLHSNFIYAMLQTRTGEILIATTRGLFQYNHDRDDFDTVTEAPDYIFYTTVFEDSEGTIWLGTIRDGLYYYNRRTGKKGRYRHDTATPGSLADNRVNRIFEDSSKRLWLATDDGLCLFHPQQQTFTTYGTRHGFLSSLIFSILEDSHRQLWVTTSKGIACFSPATGKAAVFTTANGLLNDQFNYNAVYKDSSGNMYFGSVKGMIRFNPDHFLRNSFQPPVYITGFQVFGKEAQVGDILQQSVSFTDTIVLSHDQSSFSIDFAALSYTSPAMTAYAYKMEGLDQDWTYLESNRKAYFTKLSPGAYRFLVRAANSSGNWSVSPRVLHIEILPPFWASYGAYTFYLLLLGSIIYGIISWYHQRALQKQKRQLELLAHEKEKEVYQAKIEFFTHLAHEIRTPLTLIKGPMENVIRKSAEVPQIQKNLRIMERNTDRLLDLTNQLLDFRKTEINGFSLNFVNTDIPELLKENHLRFTPAAEQKNIRFKIELSCLHFFAYTDTEALHKIVGNLLNNAIKYAGTKASVHLLPVAEGDTTFTILVKNDGPVIPPEMKEKIFEPFFRAKATEGQSGTGIGLSLSRSLTLLHKGSLELITTEPGLNVFSLTLPIHQEIEFNLSTWKINR
ncbi:ligand-binding sensor domain-containing protein [Chitinophaga solisilvae]|uniref:ligand-binding sensor domain-containing protein n=1 Tax=Chitinophaga solisilvae TaxID=1233460 RepID=UPI001370935B|nr:two-component regulator propeller domain-containing protein [Chitinophaga solisilvae]